jgi:hypothetical protein
MKKTTHKGHLITYICGHYWALGKAFERMKDAIASIDELYK